MFFLTARGGMKMPGYSSRHNTNKGTIPRWLPRRPYKGALTQGLFPGWLLGTFPAGGHMFHCSCGAFSAFALFRPFPPQGACEGGRSSERFPWRGTFAPASICSCGRRIVASPRTCVRLEADAHLTTETAVAGCITACTYTFHLR